MQQFAVFPDLKSSNGIVAKKMNERLKKKIRNWNWSDRFKMKSERDQNFETKSFIFVKLFFCPTNPKQPNLAYLKLTQLN